MKNILSDSILILSVLMTTPANAQRVVVVPYYQAYWNPVMILEYRTYAYADLVRARGNAAVDYAYARKLHAEAARMEIENFVIRLKAHYEVKAIREAEKLKRAYNHLDSKRLQNNRQWERLKNHPSLNRSAIENGNALNFLLERLGSSVLAYDYSTRAKSIDGADLEKLKLSPAVVHGLTIQQRLSGGRQLVFRVDEGKTMDTNWWPWLLRSEDFEAERENFEKQRNQVVQEAESGKISNKALNELYLAFEELRDRFNQKFTRADRLKSGMQSWQHFRRTDLFLKSLWSEVSLLRSTADISLLGAGLKFDADQHGSDLISLLKYLSRNGLEFAPAKPGDEPAYHQLFHQMRDLYINVADEDEALQPETIKYQQKLKRDGKPDISSGSVLDR